MRNWIVLPVCCALLTACALQAARPRTIYPVTSGTHRLVLSEKDLAEWKSPHTYIVVADDPQMEAALSELLIAANQRVVERAQLNRVLAEKGLQQTLGIADQEKWMDVGRVVGGQYVVFGIHTQTAYYGPTFDLSVVVRSVSVETGEVRWVGRASYPSRVNNSSLGIFRLTKWATQRALCLTERDSKWTEPFGSPADDGCQKQ